MKKLMNVGGHVHSDNSTGPFEVVRGSGTDGGVEVDLSAAKKKHNAGPTFKGDDYEYRP